MCEMVEETATEMIAVRACKFDGSIHRRWDARLRHRLDSLLILDARFEEEIRHPQLGTIERGTLSVEYYWLDRWYNVFRFHEPAGRLRNYYCNVSLPPTFDGRVLSYIDLDMDILVSPDLSYSILDEDEFRESAARFNYSSAIQTRAHRALDELVTLIEARRFPFDYRD